MTGALLIDLDGVIHPGGQPIPGALAIGGAQRAGLCDVFRPADVQGRIRLHAVVDSLASLPERWPDLLDRR